MLQLTDSHCHLEQLDDPEQVLAAAAAVGVSRVVTMAQEQLSMRQALDLARRFPGQVLAGLGIHPVHVVTLEPEQLDASLRFLAEHASEADQIGETGLDHKWATDADQQAAQDRVLDRHFELAATHRKPVNLHSRRCPRQVMEAAIAFHRHTGLGAQLHWFTQSKKLIRATNDAGIFVSVGPTILVDTQAADVAVEIDDELLLLETDAPVAIGGVAGHPSRARDTLAKLAALKGVEETQLARQTEVNFANFVDPDQVHTTTGSR
ncbi:MAG: TatD family hydrolase [Gemmatimonadetes bacterium]|nr:TatD family hydrolase [Gemmatimonadota bacterium]MBT7861791.1 TatD family hydrolase [Gemmatimonadota bacterium]